MNSLLKRRGVRQFVKFGVVGVSSTVIDWGIYLLLTRFTLIFYLIAKVVSFAVSVINSYIWNRRWTFRSYDPNKLHQFSKFMVVALVGLGLNTLIMYLVVSWFHWRDIIGLALATLIVLFWNFLINKFWTFKEVVM
ncbi:MAG: GtrA family protein [Patescibacteria group bacterium]|jgi:putative flippase GtrA